MITIASICNRAVAFTTRDTPIAAAAKLMRQGHIGSLVIVEQMNGGKRIPVGSIVTVDDILEVLSEELSELSRIVAREQAREASARK